MLSTIVNAARLRVAAPTRCIQTTQLVLGRQSKPSSISLSEVGSAETPDGMNAIADLIDDAHQSTRASASAQLSVLSEYESFRFNSFYQPLDLEKKHRTIKNTRRPPTLFGPSAPVSRARDVFHQLGIDPLNEACNSSLLTHFISEMGKIHGRGKTNLTWKSQRKIGKAIRRARNMGVIPILSNPRLRNTSQNSSRTR